jgi:hypothetical protein
MPHHARYVQRKKTNYIEKRPGLYSWLVLNMSVSFFKRLVIKASGFLCRDGQKRNTVSQFFGTILYWRTSKWVSLSRLMLGSLNSSPSREEMVASWLGPPAV